MTNSLNQQVTEVFCRTALATRCLLNMMVLSPKQNLTDYTSSIQEILAMHMQKEHNGAAPVQKSCAMCWFTSHLSYVLKNHIDSKHIGLLILFKCNNCDYSAK